MIETRTSGSARAVETGPSPVYLALAAAGLAVLVVAFLSGTGRAESSYGTCADQVAAWAAAQAPQTNGFNNEEIARHQADVQRAAAEAIVGC
ncbi:MAG: hypothetical protein ACT4QG_17805 [Sporichthyaceae bacterium]